MEFARLIFLKHSCVIILLSGSKIFAVLQVCGPILGGALYCDSLESPPSHRNSQVHSVWTLFILVSSLCSCSDFRLGVLCPTSLPASHRYLLASNGIHPKQFLTPSNILFPFIFSHTILLKICYLCKGNPLILLGMQVVTANLENIVEIP